MAGRNFDFVIFVDKNMYVLEKMAVAICDFHERYDICVYVCICPIGLLGYWSDNKLL